jgi:archaellum component FlaF (FlaF/FlaG flagellin family)
MDTAIPAFIIIMTALFTMGTFTQVSIDSFDTLSQAQIDLEKRQALQGQTHISVHETILTMTGTDLQIAIYNEGSVRLADYDDWDVIVTYIGESGSAHQLWVPYKTSDNPAINPWQLDDIYVDVDRGIAEAHDQNILNPGETMVLELTLIDPVQHGETLTASVSTEYGRGTVVYAHRNAPPELLTNERVVIAVGESVVLTNTELLAADIDHLTTQIFYMVNSAPTAGTLSLAGAFTQADIDNGIVSYTHVGPTYGIDEITFELTDGIDTVGPFTFEIKISAAPTLDVNTTLTVANGTIVAITGANLAVSDPDDLPENLTYSAMTMPLNGNLSLTTFTQEDLNNGLVTYTHSGVGSGADSFQFTVSDGINTIGAYTFQITIP